MSQDFFSFTLFDIRIPVFHRLEEIHFNMKGILLMEEVFRK